ncbi:MAG: hypothetical protein ACFFDN_51505 [Candidatus Hodarchaeota archaeon]
MRRSRIFRWLIRIFVLFLTTCVSLISFLGIVSAGRILSDPGNISIPDGDVEMYFDLTDIENSYFKVPFNVTNAGYFDLTEFYLKFDIIMIYNITGQIAKIYEKNVNFRDIPKGQTLHDIFETNSSDFKNVPAYQYVDSSVPMLFRANVTVSASYALELLSLSVEIRDFDLGTV